MWEQKHRGLTSLLFSHPPLFEEDYSARTSIRVDWGPGHTRLTVGRWTPLSVCGWPTPIVFTVCSAQLEQVGALSAAVQPIEHFELTGEAVWEEPLWPNKQKKKKHTFLPKIHKLKTCSCNFQVTHDHNWYSKHFMKLNRFMVVNKLCETVVSFPLFFHLRIFPHIKRREGI